MTVIISPNLKKTSEMIDPQGNIINPRTKEVVRSMNEGNYTPTAEEFAVLERKSQAETTPVSTDTPKQGEESPLAAIIKAQVNKAVQEQIKNIDISKMVADAIKESFK